MAKKNNLSIPTDDFKNIDMEIIVEEIAQMRYDLEKLQNGLQS
jgi:hypothetical protein